MKDFLEYTDEQIKEILSGLIDFIDPIEDDNILLRKINDYYIFLGKDDDGAYLEIEDSEHCMPMYDGEDGLALSEIFDKFIAIAQNEEAF